MTDIERRKPTAETNPWDVCPICRNFLILWALDYSQAACADPNCSAAHGYVELPPRPRR